MCLFVACLIVEVSALSHARCHATPVVQAVIICQRRKQHGDRGPFCSAKCANACMQHTGPVLPQVFPTSSRKRRSIVVESDVSRQMSSEAIRWQLQMVYTKAFRRIPGFALCKPTFATMIQASTVDQRITEVHMMPDGGVAEFQEHWASFSHRICKALLFI